MHGVARVVAGVSGSAGSLAALRHAESLARRYDAALVPVLAWTMPGGSWADMVPPPGGMHDEGHEMAWRRMREALTRVWGEVPADPSIQPRVERGPAGRVLVDAACAAADVLVVGAGRGGLRRISGCSVSRYCADRARCPVVVVPMPEIIRELGHRRLAWEFRHMTVTAERILRDKGLPAGS